MRTIQLDEDYRIEASENQWTLRFEKVGEINPTTGKPTISKNEFFHNTLENALKSYVDKKLKQGGEIFTEITKLQTRLSELFNTINQAD